MNANTSGRVSVTSAGTSLPGSAALARALARGPGSPPPLTVADLSAKHIGKKVRVTDGLDVLTGFIDDFGFLIEHQMQGMVAEGVRIEFDRATVTYPLTATVEVL